MSKKHVIAKLTKENERLRALIFNNTSIINFMAEHYQPKNDKSPKNEYDRNESMFNMLRSQIQDLNLRIKELESAKSKSKWNPL